MSHNYWAHVPQLLKPTRLKPVLHNKEKPLQWEACTQWRVASARRNYRKAACSNEDLQHSQKKKDNLLNEKIFADDMTDKGLIYNICKQLIQLNIKKTNTQFKNGQKTWIDIFPKKT